VRCPEFLSRRRARLALFTRAAFRRPVSGPNSRLSLRLAPRGLSRGWLRSFGRNLPGLASDSRNGRDRYGVVGLSRVRDCQVIEVLCSRPFDPAFTGLKPFPQLVSAVAKSGYPKIFVSTPSLGNKLRYRVSLWQTSLLRVASNCFRIGSRLCCIRWGVLSRCECSALPAEDCGENERPNSNLHVVCSTKLQSETPRLATTSRQAW
jgi:hypothetical protein